MGFDSLKVAGRRWPSQAGIAKPPLTKNLRRRAPRSLANCMRCRGPRLVRAAQKRARRGNADCVFGTGIGDSLPEIRRNYQLSSCILAALYQSLIC